MRGALALALISVLVAGCASAPRQTLAGLNRHDAQYQSRACRQVRREAARFDDHKDGRIALAVAGNLVVPLAGTAAAAAVSGAQEKRKAQLNAQLKARCISDPLAGRREARR